MSAPRSDGLVASVVVPVHNDGPALRRLLDALKTQTIGAMRFEIIVGDDGSTDGSTRGLATRDGRVRVSAAPRSTSYAARNRAARLARSPVLAFCDADCTPDPRWLERGLAAVELADIAGGAVRYCLPETWSIWTLLSIDMLFDQEHAVGLGKALGGNLFVRRDLFEREGGFDESLPSGGDGDFVLRCVAHGAKLAFAPDAVVLHPTHDRARPFLRRIWFQNRWRAVRTIRGGKRPPALRLRWWVPILPRLRLRRRLGRSILLDRRRLADYGLSPRRRDSVRAFPVMYLLLPYLSGVAQLWGWWNSRRNAKAGPRHEAVPPESPVKASTRTDS